MKHWLLIQKVIRESCLAQAVHVLLPVRASTCPHCPRLLGPYFQGLQALLPSANSMGEKRASRSRHALFNAPPKTWCLASM